jgi:thiol-disulfide isomerase/thioredoxin
MYVRRWHREAMRGLVLHPRIPKIFVGLLSMCALMACATTSKTPSHSDHGSVEWFPGPVEKAFETAKQQNKPIFLYWGAVWCPPCNQVKAEVFSTPEFAELMKLVVPVYLDGDSEGAQAWADKLNVSGYPTLLMLGPDGKELLRISEAVDITEFSAAFKGAIASGLPIDQLINRALEGRATDGDWNVLALARVDDFTRDATVVWLKLFELAPQSLVVQRSLLASKILEGVSVTKETTGAAELIRAKSKNLLDAIFSLDAGVFASRATIVYSRRSIIRRLYSEPSLERTALIARWTKAAEWLQKNPRSSLSIRLHAAAAQYELWTTEHPNQPVPKDVADVVRAEVARADREAISAYSRHAVISDAAEVLAELGDVDAARAMVLKELKTTDTPWYYQATLAGIERAAGNEASALQWSAKASESARGDATRVQWAAMDVVMNVKSEAPERDHRIAQSLSRYFDAAFGQPDGFSGRNRVRAERVRNAWASLDFQTLKSFKESTAVWSANERKCGGDLGRRIVDDERDCVCPACSPLRAEYRKRPCSVVFLSDFDP